MTRLIFLRVSQAFSKTETWRCTHINRGSSRAIRSRIVSGPSVSMRSEAFENLRILERPSRKTIPTRVLGCAVLVGRFSTEERPFKLEQNGNVWALRAGGWIWHSHHLIGQA